jgi:hypothetical protein
MRPRPPSTEGLTNPKRQKTSADEKNHARELQQNLNDRTNEHIAAQALIGLQNKTTKLYLSPIQNKYRLCVLQIPENTLGQLHANEITLSSIVRSFPKGSILKKDLINLFLIPTYGIYAQRFGANPNKALWKCINRDAQLTDTLLSEFEAPLRSDVEPQSNAIVYKKDLSINELAKFSSITGYVTLSYLANCVFPAESLREEGLTKLRNFILEEKTPPALCLPSAASEAHLTLIGKARANVARNNRFVKPADVDNEAKALRNTYAWTEAQPNTTSQVDDESVLRQRYRHWVLFEENEVFFTETPFQTLECSLSSLANSLSSSSASNSFSSSSSSPSSSSASSPLGFFSGLSSASSSSSNSLSSSSSSLSYLSSSFDDMSVGTNHATTFGRTPPTPLLLAPVTAANARPGRSNSRSPLSDLLEVVAAQQANRTTTRTP